MASGPSCHLYLSLWFFLSYSFSISLSFFQFMLQWNWISIWLDLVYLSRSGETSRGQHVKLATTGEQMAWARRAPRAVMLYTHMGKWTRRTSTITYSPPKQQGVRPNMPPITGNTMLDAVTSRPLPDDVCVRMWVVFRRGSVWAQNKLSARFFLSQGLSQRTWHTQWSFSHILHVRESFSSLATSSSQPFYYYR